MRNQPMISTFCGVNIVFIGKTDETIFYGIIEFHMHTLCGGDQCKEPKYEGCFRLTHFDR
jgi:hypothetical protein